MDQRQPFEVEYPPTEQGTNKWVWDMRRNGLHCGDDIRLFEGFTGAYVMPGTYQARISIGDAEDTATLTVVADRRVETSSSDFAEVENRIVEMTALMNELLDGLAAIRKSRAQIEALLAEYPDAEPLQRSGAGAVARLSTWQTNVLQVEFKTYEDEDNLTGKFVKQVRHLLDVIDDAGPPLAAGALERLEDLKREWAGLQAELREISASDIAAVNAWARTNAEKHVRPPWRQDKIRKRITGSAKGWKEILSRCRSQALVETAAEPRGNAGCRGNGLCIIRKRSGFEVTRAH